MRSLKVNPLGYLAILLAVFAGTHLYIGHKISTVHFMGDEHVYLNQIQMDAGRGLKGLLPGTQGFYHRPRFNCRVLSMLYPEDQELGFEQTVTSFMRRVSAFHVGVMLLVLIAMYLLGVWLGLGRYVALVPPLILALFPWFEFYIYSLWPEVIHAALLTVSFALLILYSRRSRRLLLIPAGILLGYTLLTKGVVVNFLPVLAAFVAVSTFLKSRNGLKHRLIQSALSVLVLVGAIAVIAFPQLYVNHTSGHGFRLSANTWWNIEIGIRGAAPSDPPELSKATFGSVRREYLQGPIEDREARAKERTIQFLRAHPPGMLLSRQAEKYWFLFTQRPSILEEAIQLNRWRQNDTKWVASLAKPSRWMFYGIVAVGFLGTLALLKSGPGWTLLSLFSLYILVSLFAVPFNLRFLMQLMPSLCLLSVGGIVRCVRWLHGQAPSLCRSSAGDSALHL